MAALDVWITYDSVLTSFLLSFRCIVTIRSASNTGLSCRFGAHPSCSERPPNNVHKNLSAISNRNTLKAFFVRCQLHDSFHTLHDTLVAVQAFMLWASDYTLCGSVVSPALVCTRDVRHTRFDLTTRLGTVTLFRAGFQTKISLLSICLLPSHPIPLTCVQTPAPLLRPRRVICVPKVTSHV